MTEQQATEIIQRLDSLNIGINELNGRISGLQEILISHLNNLSHGIKFLMIVAGAVFLMIVLKLVWGLFYNWFFGGI